MTDRTVEAVFDAVAAVAPDVRASFAGRRTGADAENPTGQRQLEADVYADGLLEERLLAVDGVGTYASEEREGVVGDGDGLSVAVDPLDGSSNLPSNNPVGTVVGVYDGPLPAPGRDLVAAGYVLYGPLTTMTVARESVTRYAVEGGERRVLAEGVRLPDDPLVYGFGGRVPQWPDAFRAYAREVEDELKLRYGGAMVADVNQVLTYGGVFAYPALRDHPRGKLRLCFEGAPVAYLVETAGGRSSDGARSLLDATPEGLHDRVPVHVGSAAYVERLERALA